MRMTPEARQFLRLPRRWRRETLRLMKRGLPLPIAFALAAMAQALAELERRSDHG